MLDEDGGAGCSLDGAGHCQSGVCGYYYCRHTSNIFILSILEAARPPSARLRNAMLGDSGCR